MFVFILIIWVFYSIYWFKRTFWTQDWCETTKKQHVSTNTYWKLHFDTNLSMDWKIFKIEGSNLGARHSTDFKLKGSIKKTFTNCYSESLLCCYLRLLCCFASLHCWQNETLPRSLSNCFSPRKNEASVNQFQRLSFFILDWIRDFLGV